MARQVLSARTDHGPRKRQRGMMMALFTIAMIVMLGMVGLAIDSSHGFLNKTRLQNAVDAAALSAAKTLDQTAGDTVLAAAEAFSMFSQNASNLGNAEMESSYSAGDISLSVEFSATLHPFVSGTAPADYVRVTATNFRLPGWFIPVLGFNEKIVGASAVAGPSPPITIACNIAPMLVCGDPTAAPEDHFGYELMEADVLKSSTSSFEVGPGNFQLIRLDGGQGGADVREAMAGSYAGCLETEETVPTEPGNTVGPVVQGLNTRFGEYRGPMQGMESDYPPDVVTKHPGDVDGTLLTYDSDTDTIYFGSEPLDGDPDPAYFDFNKYIVADPDYTPVENGGIGVYRRRTLAVPVGDCTEATNGQGDVPVLGFLCYHLIQPAQQKGNESHVYGQFIETGCAITGRPGPEPGTGPGPYRIQLYKDETQEAS